jgi:formiminotetrahydrofolate cyclodeaminase
MYSKVTLKEFIDDLASSSPAPGGGAAGAYAAAIAAALTSMVANLTVNKKKYSDYQGTMEEVIAYTKTMQLDLIDLISEDINAFNEVMKAYKLPKDTQENKQLRKDEIQKSLKNATETPMKLCEMMKNLFKYIETVAKYGNKNAISDAASANELAYATFNIGSHNVMINF